MNDRAGAPSTPQVLADPETPDADSADASDESRDALAQRPGETLAEAVQRVLEREIVSHPLRPGTRLWEHEVALRFGVSRTPVREAFRLLAAGGLVKLRGRQGAIVASISMARLLEMFQVMAELEGLCARLAARRITAAAHRELTDIHQRLAVAADTMSPELFYEINQEFHEAIYEAAKNDFLAQQTRALRNRVSPYRRQVTYMPGRIRATVNEHQEVLQAIERHDPDAAAFAMRDHVNLLGDSLTDFIAVFQTQPSEGTPLRSDRTPKTAGQTRRDRGRARR